MLQHLRSRLVFASAICLVATATLPARGALVTSITEVSTPGDATGLTRYTYTVQNNATSTLPISAFFVNVNPNFNVTQIVAPTGFDISYNPSTPGVGGMPSTLGDPDILFTSSSSATDIAPQGAGVFSFESGGPSGQVPYAFRALDSTGAFASQTPAGLTTVGPAAAAVPEPSSLLLVALGAVGVLGCRRLRQGQPARD